MLKRILSLFAIPFLLIYAVVSHLIFWIFQFPYWILTGKKLNFRLEELDEKIISFLDRNFPFPFSDEDNSN